MKERPPWLDGTNSRQLTSALHHSRIARNMAVAVEVQPHVVQLGDHSGIRRSLDDLGYALVRNAATPSELQHARELLLQHLDEVHSWKQGQPLTWTDDAYGPTPSGGGFPHGATAGIMTSTCHSDCFWYVRTLPGVLDSFAAAYGTEDLVAAYDNMAINRPASCGQESVLSLGNGRGEGVTHRWDQSLHNHFNQDGFGEDVYICYAIMPLFDMNEKTGATAVRSRPVIVHAEDATSQKRRSLAAY